MTHDPDMLFTGADPQGHVPHVFQFLDLIKDKYKIPLADYKDLWLWSITHIDEFWSTIWDHCNIIGVAFVFLTLKTLLHPNRQAKRATLWLTTKLYHKTTQPGFLTRN